MYTLARQRIQLRTWLVQALRGRFRFCLPCHTCLSVSFVSQFSRSHSLLAFLTVLGFRVSLVDFTIYLTFLSLWILTYCWLSSCFVIFKFLWPESLYFQPFSSCPAIHLVSVQPNGCMVVFSLLLISILFFKFGSYVVEVIFALLQQQCLGSK